MRMIIIINIHLVTVAKILRNTILMINHRFSNWYKIDSRKVSVRFFNGFSIFATQLILFLIVC